MTLKFYFLSINLLLISVLLFGQQKAPAILWSKCFGGSLDDKAYSIANSGDGGYVIVGSSLSNDGNVTGHHGSTDSTDAWVIKVSSSGALVWEESLGGSGQDELDYITNTSDGGFIGYGSTTSNDGDVSGNHGAQDLWVVKLDSNGNLQWQKCLGGSGSEYSTAATGFGGPFPSNNIVQTSDGGYILIGNTQSTDGQVTGNVPIYSPYRGDSLSGMAIWVVKLDNQGNIQWENAYTNVFSLGNYIFPLPSGEYLIGLNSQYQASDFASATYLDPASVVAKISSTGQIINSVLYTPNGQGSFGPVSIKQLSGNRFFVMTADINCYGTWEQPMVTITLSDSTFGNYTEYYNGISGGGQFSIYCVDTDSLIGIWGTSIAILSNGSGVFAGTYSNVFTNTGYSNEVYPPNYHQLPDGYLASFAPQGWQMCYGGSSTDAFTGLIAENDYTYVAGGYTSSNDGDVSGNHGENDFWIVKLGNGNLIRGTVFADYNSNGIKDSSEPCVNGIVVQSQKGSSTSASSVFNGLFSNLVDTGTYTTSALTPALYYHYVPASHQSTFSTYDNTDSFSIAMQPIPGITDFAVELNGLDPELSVLNDSLPYYIYYSNLGTDTLTNKNITLIYDTLLKFLSSTPSPTLIKGDTIIWTIPSLLPRQWAYINIQTQLNIPAGASISNFMNDTLVSVATIDTTGDVNKANNVSLLRQPIYYAFDPNNKQEINGGYISTTYVSNGNYLLYTIYFQNSGTDTAYNILVTDTLGTKLDNTSLEMVNASGPYHLSITNGNNLNWTLTNAKLPDSAQNPAGSHGFITYKIKPLSSLVAGDTILNYASVYFDYNPPVVTNTETTVIRQGFLPQPLIAGLDSMYCSNMDSAKIKVLNLPGASYQATVSATLDTSSVTIAADSILTFNPSALAQGNHQLEVVYTNSVGSTSSTNSFQVIPVVTPKVQLSASDTIINSGSSTVTITANAVSGGGSAPQYSFASDRAFTNVLQQNSGNNSISIQPSTLKAGGNWIYVQMKTSDTCYTTQTVIDSIHLLLNTAIGLVDPDFPNQVISIYPNPFNHMLTISGLQTSKAYDIIITDANGRQVLTQQPINVQQWVIAPIVVAKGVYELRLYDETKNRSIGIIKLVAD